MERCAVADEQEQSALTIMIFSSTFPVIVKPGSNKDEYLGIDEKGRHIVRIKNKAIDNKANIGLIKFFKKEFNIRIRIKSGLTSREKIIEVI